MYSKLESQLKQSGIIFKTLEPMSEHTSFKIGGRAKIFIIPASVDECVKSIELCNSLGVPYHIIGKGTNLLVRDEGIDAAVICISSAMSKIEMISDNEIYCEAGASLASVCLFALDNSLGGMEFAYGIPGNLGGAIVMNAGAYGGEIKDIIVSCKYIDENGNICEINKDNMDLSYRHSIFSDKKCCVVSAVLSLSKDDKEVIKEKMTDYISRRKEKQPLDFPSAGSTFKRPEGSYASMLIDQCGLKGFSVGGAKVSEKHAGFVINYNSATCEDVISLVEKIQQIVFEKTGYNLETEIKIM